jgi:bacillopeptidase F (M6 metalloprotease family)
MKQISFAKLTLFLLTILFANFNISAQESNPVELITIEKSLKKLLSNFEKEPTLSFVVNINDKKDAAEVLTNNSTYYQDYIFVEVMENYKNNPNQIGLNINFISNQKEGYYSAQRLLFGNGFSKLTVGKETFATDEFFEKHIIPLGQ